MENTRKSGEMTGELLLSKATYTHSRNAMDFPSGCVMDAAAKWMRLWQFPFACSKNWNVEIDLWCRFVKPPISAAERTKICSGIYGFHFNKEFAANYLLRCSEICRCGKLFTREEKKKFTLPLGPPWWGFLGPPPASREDMGQRVGAGDQGSLGSGAAEGKYIVCLGCCFLHQLLESAEKNPQLFLHQSAQFSADFMVGVPCGNLQQNVWT